MPYLNRKGIQETEIFSTKDISSPSPSERGLGGEVTL
jgi:hypothetical protein